MNKTITGTVSDKETSLDYVALKEDGVWVVHGLQHNIVSHGNTKRAAIENFELVFKVYGKDLLNIQEASKLYWNLFNEITRSL